MLARLTGPKPSDAPAPRADEQDPPVNPWRALFDQEFVEKAKLAS